MKNLGQFVYSPRLLRDRKKEAEESVLRLYRNSVPSPIIVSAMKSIASLRPSYRLSTSLSFRKAKETSLSVFERVEVQWNSGLYESVEQLIAQAAVLGPTAQPQGAIPRSLIEHLCKTPLGVEVLKSAIRTLPVTRLHGDCNYEAIVHALKERSRRQSREYKLLRRKRAAELCS